MNHIRKKNLFFLFLVPLIFSIIYKFINNFNHDSKESYMSIFIFQLILTSIIMLLQVLYSSCFKSNDSKKFFFKYWNPKSKALNKLIEYVSEVTSEDNPNFIPIMDRIALFDFDGTIYGEKGPLYIEYFMYYEFLKNEPKFKEIEPHKSIYLRLEKSCQAKKLIDFELEYDAIESEAKIYKGYTIKEHQDFVKKFAEKNSKCFTNLKFKDMFYLPMIELVEFLQLNNFIIYIVSASDRFLVREYLKYHFKIPEQNVIATDVELMPKSEEENFEKTKKLNEYFGYKKDDYLIRNGNLIKKNVQLSKVRMVAREIGKKPILSFGNSSSDVPLQNFVLYNNKYKSQAYMVVADDMKREYGMDEIEPNGSINTKRSDEIKKKWTSKEYGYNIISMRDDFKTIYGPDVKLVRYE